MLTPSILWSKFSTTATFSDPGVYVLELAATSNLAQTSAPLAVTVVPPPGAFDSWLALHFGPAPDPVHASDLADPDNDGLANLLGFATGTLLKTPDGSVTSLTNNSEALNFAYRRSHAAVADGVEFMVEWSSALSDGWSASGVTQSPVPGSNNGVSTLWQATLPAGNGRRFA